MKELPTPTFPLSPAFLSRTKSFLGMSRAPAHAALRGIEHFASPVLSVPVPLPAQPEPSDSDRVGASPVPDVTPARFAAVWARHLDEVREAQRLRYSIFSGEMGARLQTAANAAYPGHDIDMFDDFCEHLLVRNTDTGEVIGTYRVLTPAQARRIGTTYTDTEFDLTRLRGMRDRMVELGRSCVHQDYRHGGVIMALGGALFEFLVRNQFHSMIGCASIPMSHHGENSGHAAASIWRQAQERHLAPIEHQVFPRCALPVDQLDQSLPVEPPALIKGYLRLGAKVLGPPAWDPVFNSADLPIMARLEDLPARYRKHFLGA